MASPAPWADRVRDSRPAMRASTMLAGLLCAFGLVWLGRAPMVNDSAAQPLAAQPIQPPARAVAAPAPALERQRSTQRAIRLVDRLTGMPLEAEVQLRSGATSQPLASAPTWDLAACEPDASLVYRLPDGSERVESLAESLRDDDHDWLLALPYACRVVVELPADVDASLEGEFFLCRPPAMVRVDAEEPPESGPFELGGVDMTATGALTWALRSHRVEVLAEGSAREPAVVAASGSAVLAVHLADGRDGYGACVLQPGEEVLVQPAWRSRPVLAGVLVDWEGNPVPNARVRLAVAMDLADYDFRPSDPHAMAALRISGVLHHTLMRRLKTDAEGRFSVVAPHGRDYALYTHALGGYAMWNTLHEPSARNGREDLVLRLEEVSDDSAVTFTVRRPDGSPFVGARVEVSVVSDVPFIRQWPDDRVLGEDGSVRVLGLEVGEEVCLIVRHDDLDSVFGSNYMIVPPTRSLTVDIPSHRMPAPVRIGE